MFFIKICGEYYGFKRNIFNFIVYWELYDIYDIYGLFRELYY